MVLSWSQHLLNLIAFGVTREEKKRIEKRDKTAPQKYLAQKYAAKQRGIGWELTLTEWWDIWMRSKKWRKRGQGRGRYCMGRNGDIGPYAVGNVRIITHEQNTTECVSRRGSSYPFRYLELGGSICVKHERPRDLHKMLYLFGKSAGMKFSASITHPDILTVTRIS